MTKQLREWNWRDYAENGEVNIQTMANYYGMADNAIIAFAKRHHGVRYDSELNIQVMSVDDAEILDQIFQEEWRR